MIVLTSLGAKSGKVRKNALMRVEHQGTYAVVASQGARRAIPPGTTTWSRTRWSSCRTVPCART